MSATFWNMRRRAEATKREMAEKHSVIEPVEEPVEPVEEPVEKAKKPSKGRVKNGK